MMATALAPVTTPTMKDILLDLDSVKTRLNAFYVGGREPSDEEHRLWDALDDEKERLELAFATAFKALTGVRWTNAVEVMS